MEQVKKGYKKTEVGVIPEEWNTLKIGSFANCTSGGTPSTIIPSYWAGDIPWMNSGELNLKHVRNVENRISDEGLRNSSTKFIPKYSVLIGLAGQGKTRGTAAINYLELCTNQSIASIFPSNIHNPFFLYYFLDSQYYELRKLSTGDGGRGGLNLGIIKNIVVPIPTLTEQKAIATALSDVDELITKLEKLIEKKKAIKQGAMQQLLTPPNKGGKRLEGYSGEWERIQLNKVITVARGGSPRPIQDFITTNSDGVDWIKIGDTSSKSKFITSSVEKIIPEGAQFSRKVCSGDFLLSNSMSFGRPYILKIDGCIHDGWLVLQNYQDSFDTEFLYYTLMSNDVFNQYLMKASGSSVLNLNKEIVKTVELNRPTNLDEQRAIAKIFKEMDEEIVMWESRKEKYKIIKQGMMQELLTGKTRLI